MNRINLLFIVGVAMAVVSYWYTLLDTDIHKPSPVTGTGIKVGQILPPLSLEGLDGSPVKISPSGKIIVLNFWATWCKAYREEMPGIEKFYQQNQKKVEFYAINSQDSRGEIIDFMTRSQYTMTVLLDKDGIVGEKFQVTAIPTTIIINKHGMIKYHKSGAITRTELEGIVNSL